MQFDKDSDQCIVIMYPTGGYGNFLYYLLTQYFKDTVKVKENQNFKFSPLGNSHNVYKYTEVFSFGSHYNKLDKFSYNYKIYDRSSQEQILNGKKYLVLGDTGNLVDSVKFLKKYFPNATIIRTYAETFEEKLVLWANCITKSAVHHHDIYKDSLHTIDGIAQFANKTPNQITDQDAINCLIDFLKNDFGKFGKFYSQSVDNVINVPFKSFFNRTDLIKILNFCAIELDTEIINKVELEKTIDEFISTQHNFDLLDINYNTGIVGAALQECR